MQIVPIPDIAEIVAIDPVVPDPSKTNQVQIRGQLQNGNQVVLQLSKHAARELLAKLGTYERIHGFQ